MKIFINTVEIFYVKVRKESLKFEKEKERNNFTDFVPTDIYKVKVVKLILHVEKEKGYKFSTN